MLVLLAISLGYFMVILDATAVTVALPAVRADIGGSVAELQWVLDAYTLVFAALLLSAGALGDRTGARRVLVGGLMLFGLASALCGAAPSADALIAARAVQGLGAAAMVPTSLALLREAFPEERARARAIGVWGGIAGVAAASGPVLGGALVSGVSWRAVFWLNVPVALLALGLALRCLPTGTRTRGAPLDLLAQPLAIGAPALLTFGLIEAGSRGWGDPLVLGAFAGALVLGGAFVAWERHAARRSELTGRGGTSAAPDRSAAGPMLPPALLARRGVSVGSTVGLLINLGFYGQLFVVNLALQDSRGYGALRAGLAILPEAVMVSIASFVAGRLVARFGPRLPMLLGLTLGAAGLVGLAFAMPHAPYLAIVPGMLATGSGMALTMPSATAAVVADAPAERTGVASGVLNAGRQLGGTIGVALLGTLVGASAAGGPLRDALLAAAAAFVLGALATLAWLPPARRSRRAERSRGAPAERAR